MTRWNGSLRVGSVSFVAAMLVGAAGCGSRASDQPERLTATSSLAPVSVAPSAPAPVAAAKDSAPILVRSAIEPEKAVARSATLLRPGESGLAVKRFVVTSGVNAREPLLTEGDLPADGSPIFAFAELANTSDRDQEVRVTFERQGSNERVGNVSLTIPAKSPRYRTWAKTRYVREAGTWVAVIVNEHGTELGRSTFETNGAPAS